MNHSCDSNLWMGDEVTVVARRAIAAGEELTIDHALQSGLPVEVLGEPCHYGSRACRGGITGNDWQRKELQERYQGHFSPFLRERLQPLPVCLGYKSQWKQTIAASSSLRRSGMFVL